MKVDLATAMISPSMLSSLEVVVDGRSSMTTVDDTRYLPPPGQIDFRRYAPNPAKLKGGWRK